MIKLVGGGQDTRANWPDFRSLSTLLRGGQAAGVLGFSFYSNSVCDPNKGTR